MVVEFEASHTATYSFLMNRPLIVEAISVEAIGLTSPPDLSHLGEPDEGARSDLEPADTVRLYARDTWRDAPLYQRERMRADDAVTGPAIIAEPNATTVVDDGWRATLTTTGHLLVERVAARDETGAGTEVDPVLLEIFNNLFMSIAEQMGTRLEATAQSVNIRERLDFSCALFDPDGNLVANAPHIPVHLGSMGTSVKEVIRRRAGRMKPGDVYTVNDPYHGGTHLPDITVITPVFDTAPAEARAEDTEPVGARGSHSARGDILFYVASRGHHAEIGGITPGSMPATSREVHEEGVLFDNWLLVENGRFREAETRRLLTEAPYPSRNPDTNLADLRAQIAANAKGDDEVRKMIDHFGLDVVQSYMRHVQDNAEEAVRRVIDTLTDGEYRYEMDSGAGIAVKITVDREARAATIDFTGTSPQLGTNFNAPSSVATAAVLYVFRTLVADDIPLNDGCLRPLQLVIPERLHARPGVPRCRGRGQRGDLPSDHRRAICRPRRAGRRIRDDEQPDVRQRATPILRNHRLRLRCRRRIPRSIGCPDTHDELPTHRPRSPRMAIPRAARRILNQPRHRRVRPMARRRRSRPPHPVPRADDRQHAVWPPASPALRHGRWRDRLSRPQPRPPRGRGDRGTARLWFDRSSAWRHAGNRHSGRWWIRPDSPTGGG